MNSKVETITPIEQLDCMKSNKLQASDQESAQNVEEPNGETTVKKAIVELDENQPNIKQELLNESKDNIKEENNELNSVQDVVMKDEADQKRQSETNKVDDQDADVEEEVVERDEERDKVGQDGILDDGASSMGRNRRVRQKNRYFLDFHCIDLTKGGRSNKDEYEAFTNVTTATTRSSNRRSTLDSNRASQDEPDVFETKYCRKCSSRTPHDLDSGCQACLYKKIVESSKRQRPSNQRNRSSASRHQQQQQQQQLQSQDATVTSNTSNHIAQAATITSTPVTSSVTSSKNNNPNSTNNNKRKAAKQSGPSNKIANNSIQPSAENNIIAEGQRVSNSDSNSSCSANINNSSNQTSSDTSSGNSNAVNSNEEADDTNQPTTNKETSKGLDGEQVVDNKFPRLDSWSPNEVADYILSKGFAAEAELFKSQSVDGISLLLMQRTDFTFGLKIKLGPALKIYDQVCKLKKEYFRNMIRSSQMISMPTNTNSV